MGITIFCENCTLNNIFKTQRNVECVLLAYLFHEAFSDFRQLLCKSGNRFLHEVK